MDSSKWTTIKIYEINLSLERKLLNVQENQVISYQQRYVIKCAFLNVLETVFINFRNHSRCRQKESVLALQLFRLWHQNFWCLDDFCLRLSQSVAQMLPFTWYSNVFCLFDIKTARSCHLSVLCMYQTEELETMHVFGEVMFIIDSWLQIYLII